MSKIKRRDFINGTLMAAGAAMVPLGCDSNTVLNHISPLYYPPSLIGLRGSHPGSNTHAHAKAWKGKKNWGTTTDLKESYDLIVVGGGISGLAAAYFYQQKYGQDKSILILDNHDDFGGHAKRNEHFINGQMRIGYGGSQTIVEPKQGSKAFHKLLQDIGINLAQFKTAYDKRFYERNNLGAVTYFSREVFGVDKIVRHPFCNYPNYVEGLMARDKLSNEAAVQQAPLSKRGREQLLRVLNGGLHELNIPKDKLDHYINSHSYFDYLKNTLGVDDQDVLKMARNSGLDWGLTGTDLMTIATAKNVGAMGFIPKKVYDIDNPYIHHFPDGNASIARALVKKMIPQITREVDPNALLLSTFNYEELDKSSNTTRIRLNSTVVDVKHISHPKNSNGVIVGYIQNNQSYQVKGENVIMACYNMMIPHIVSDLPKEQASALSLQSKCPLQYTSVGLKNWRAMKEMEIGMAMSPGNMHQAVMMDFPVSMAGYDYTKTPEDPCLIQMISCPYGTTIGAPAIEQYREARYTMLSLEFKDYENEIRAHLSGMLPKELFDFDRDVESITVNRWAHGYTVGGPGDSVKVGRQPFGRITIANCDSAPGADAKTAIEMALRAVKELN